MTYRNDLHREQRVRHLHQQFRDDLITLAGYIFVFGLALASAAVPAFLAILAAKWFGVI